MRADFQVFIDACVPANRGVCDLLLSLAERPRLFVPHWSARILEEVKRTHLAKVNWPERLVDLFQREITHTFPEAEVSGFEKFVPTLSNHQKDRHVLAAAICGGCSVILTFNLKHFGHEHLTEHHIRARHPEDHLRTLRARAQTGDRRPGRNRRTTAHGNRRCSHLSWFGHPKVLSLRSVRSLQVTRWTSRSQTP